MSAFQPIKKTLARVFAGPVFDPTKQSAVVPIRHMKFDFEPEKIDPKFYMNAELASAYFASLSIFLTRGEDLVIDTARYHRDFIQDPVLRQRVTSLIGQEAIHSRMHEEMNEAYRARNLPVQFFRKLEHYVFAYGFERMPQPMKLSLMAAIEHFTAVLAEYMMNHEEIFFDLKFPLPPKPIQDDIAQNISELKSKVEQSKADAFNIKTLAEQEFEQTIFAS